MAEIASTKERLEEGRRFERSGDLAAAAAIYRKITDKDPLNQEVVSRLLVVYRRLKRIREELAVINRVLAAYKKQDKARQDKWVREHSKAAAVGTAVFQQLGGASVSAFAADPVVATLIRRKEAMERKISGKKGVTQQKAPAEQKKQEVQDRKAAAERRKQEDRERRKVEAAGRREEAKRRKVEAAAKKAREAEARKAEEENRQPSLYLVTLSYRVALKEIDAAMAAHLAFLNKQCKKGTILVSGRQVPRVGGIILARGKNRRAVERMMQADPLVKKALATIEVVEFKPSRTARGLANVFAE